ncbi:hypothetical protein PVAP13_5NG085481 [Panicum virgatum]|uniref:Uncharacterized protein n=1 Tax=Panicum virgatum TaxID=38727 RepID=A0A8T0RNW5_PANVG|nr:hypothetical protein PVAP13_5NG085481 [Panicum virgatum]
MECGGASGRRGLHTPAWALRAPSGVSGFQMPAFSPSLHLALAPRSVGMLPESIPTLRTLPSLPCMVLTSSRLKKRPDPSRGTPVHMA